jgi:hypothetical protein
LLTVFSKKRSSKRMDLSSGNQKSGYRLFVNYI